MLATVEPRIKAVLDRRGLGEGDDAGAAGGNHAHYVPSGHLVYTAAGTLRAIPFDLNRLATRGTPVTVLPKVPTLFAAFELAAMDHHDLHIHGEGRLA